MCWGVASSEGGSDLHTWEIRWAKTSTCSAKNLGGVTSNNTRERAYTSDGGIPSSMERQRCEKAGFHVCVTCVCVCLSPSFPCAQRFSQASGPYAPSIGRYPIFNNTNYALNKHPFPLFFRRLFQYISWNQIRVKKRRFFDVISLWGVDAERVGWEIARTTITHLSHSVWIFFFFRLSLSLSFFSSEKLFKLIAMPSTWWKRMRKIHLFTTTEYDAVYPFMSINSTFWKLLVVTIFSVGSIVYSCVG